MSAFVGQCQHDIMLTSTTARKPGLNDHMVWFTSPGDHSDFFFSKIFRLFATTFLFIMLLGFTGLFFSICDFGAFFLFLSARLNSIIVCLDEEFVKYIEFYK